MRDVLPHAFAAGRRSAPVLCAACNKPKRIFWGQPTTVFGASLPRENAFVAAAVWGRADFSKQSDGGSG
jgi:hypothetical protein